MKNLLILIGPSAGGKSTFANFLEQNDFKEVVSMTTRPKRQNEVHGESYFFCSEKDFITYIKNGVMIEYAEYCGNYYGNHVDFLIKQVEQNHQSPPQLGRFQILFLWCLLISNIDFQIFRF